MDARDLPLVMWHGFGQFSKTWETTPDGREGFQNIFLRRGVPVYLIDQPRRGGAGRGTVGTTIDATPDDQQWFNTFRLDNIPDEPSDNPGHDGWRVRLDMARLWAEAVNRRGGDVTVVHLPEIGIHGNTHFPFSDLNNREIADLMSAFLAEKRLDGELVDSKPGR